jgi:hypothetical protein
MTERRIFALGKTPYTGEWTISEKVVSTIPIRVEDPSLSGTSPF